MLLDLIKRSRSYRGFDPNRKVTREELEYFVECARFAPTSGNQQAIKFYLACDEKTVNAIQPLTGWARGLPELHLPHDGRCPTAFVVICLDQSIHNSIPMFSRDAAIAAQTMLLAAAEMGLGGCMIGSFQAGTMREALSLADTMQPLLVVAFGKPDETVVLTDAADGNIAYYRDEQDVHYVPKRSREELILN